MLRSANFVLLGCCGSALVSFTVSAACWSFPGKEADRETRPLSSPSVAADFQVGPILALCNGAFGMTSAALPLAFKLLHPGCEQDDTTLLPIVSSKPVFGTAGT